MRDEIYDAVNNYNKEVDAGDFGMYHPPDRVRRWVFCAREFGWLPDQTDSIPHAQLTDMMTYLVIEAEQREPYDFERPGTSKRGVDIDSFMNDMMTVTPKPLDLT